MPLANPRGSFLVIMKNAPKPLNASKIDKMRYNWNGFLLALWWVILVLAMLFLVYKRFEAVSSATPTYFDLGLLSLVITLLLLPFVSEMSAFGFTIKRQIEEVKEEVKEEVQSIRNEIFALGISNRLTSNVVFQAGLPNPPPDNALDEIRLQISEVLRQFQQQRGIHQVLQPSGSVSDGTMFAFEQRYLIEQTVRRIWTSRLRNEGYNRYPPFAKMVGELVQYELVTPELGTSLREVYAIASSVVHGDEPSREKIVFLQNVAPQLIATLNAIN